MSKKREMSPEQKQKAIAVGARIRAMREQRGYTQKEFGPIVGLSENACAQWEGGYVLPRANNLNRIAEALGTTSDYLWSGDDPDEQARAHTSLELRALKAIRRMEPEKVEALLAFLEERAKPTK
jgi:transcriptional regulator with XRE-family HTH domain